MSYEIEGVNIATYFNHLQRLVMSDITAMHALDTVGVKADEYIQLKNAKMLYSATKGNIARLQEFLAKLQNLVEQTEESVCWNALCDLHFSKEAKNYV
ncbi:hypothetical protein [Treponema pedis]|uniref:hypothetical protein n=1 Tax=Treponema pedis TaxID=409322 RepID=UPI0031412FFF